MRCRYSGSCSIRGETSRRRSFVPSITYKEENSDDISFFRSVPVCLTPGSVVPVQFWGVVLSIYKCTRPAGEGVAFAHG